MDSKIKEYQILTAQGALGLTAMVRNSMALGWEPIGGVCCAVAFPNETAKIELHYSQAMVKR